MTTVPTVTPLSETTEELAPRSPRYESLTVWRGVACLLVVVCHSVFNGYPRPVFQDPGSTSWILEVISRFWTGVPIFFVISGYCITASADMTRQRRKPGLTFFWRRFRRIYPPYWIWLGLVVVVVWAVEGFFHSNFFVTVDAGAVPNPVPLSLWKWVVKVTL